jgi:hypothetical protein
VKQNGSSFEKNAVTREKTMGLTIATLRARFPRSANALDKHHALIDSIVMSPAERMRVKASATTIMLMVAEETIGIGQNIEAAKTAASFVGGLFKHREKK